MGLEVIRPTIAGLMGAYGAALYARSKKRDESSIIGKEELWEMKAKMSSVRCQGCTNHCLLTINDFGGKRRLISGNKCEKPITGKKKDDDSSYNIYQYKQELLKAYIDDEGDGEKSIGLPLALGMYELLPFYHTLFKELGYRVVTSPFSNRELYISGQSSIPSDTVCFPAKLMHGHVEYLKRKGVDEIFIPASSYNVNEEKGNNHFNCPVVAYYGEVIRGNQDLEGTKLVLAYLSPDNEKHFTKRISELFGIPRHECKKAVKKAYEELGLYHERVNGKADEIIRKAREEKRRIIVLSGRPYHVDPEINHGIDKLIVSLGASVVSEDSIAVKELKKPVDVLNQWTYHARLYDASHYVLTEKDMDLVQLISFGCGLDAVTSDEVREILERGDKIPTQLKIDEITNLGAVKIRIRGLFAALDMKENETVY